MARVGEINRLTWDDLNLESGYVILYTRKKTGGHLTPRKVPMTKKLYEVLSWRYQERDAKQPWYSGIDIGAESRESTSKGHTTTGRRS